MSTGYVYDPIFLKHTCHGHPESADRLHAILRALAESNLQTALTLIPARAATPSELAYAHHPGYIARVEDACARGGGYLDPDTYTTPHTYQAATVAAGSLIDLTLAVVDGAVQNGFALVRPPGHHATPNRAMGFCLFCNVAIAARAAQRQRGLERIAIVDFDVHHGNGTQDIVRDDPGIFFCSSHQYPYYPGTGDITETGEGAAKGTIMNFPLPVGVGDEGFKTLYTEVLLPALRRFRPQLLLVSAGYDAHWDDPLAQLGLSLTGIAWLSQTLVAAAGELCDGKIVFTLEGGYNLHVLGNGVANSLRALLGRTDFVDPLGPSPRAEPDIRPHVQRLQAVHGLVP